MKLLGWMHRKFRQNSADPLMSLTTEPTYSFAQSRQPNKKCQRFSNAMKESGIEEVFEEEASYELFHGFLAIGTLGSESINTDPPTPTFPMPFQNVTEKEIEVTEDELKLINNELEKFLEAEAKEVANESSARSSQESTITFSNKHLDDTDAEDWETPATFPLQKYLLGSSIELPETAVSTMKERTSLEELFRRNDIGYEKATKKSDCRDKQAKKQYAKYFMKKIMEKLHSTARSCTTASTKKATESEAIKRKFPKVPKIFHRKVHPEELIAEKQFAEGVQNKIKKISSNSSIMYSEDTGKRQTLKKANQKANLKRKLSKLVLSSKRLDSGSITDYKEHWIKTDADYLVLEL